MARLIQVSANTPKDRWQDWILVTGIVCAAVFILMPLGIVLRGIEKMTAKFGKKHCCNWHSPTLNEAGDTFECVCKCHGR